MKRRSGRAKGSEEQEASTGESRGKQIAGERNGSDAVKETESKGRKIAGQDLFDCVVFNVRKDAKMSKGESGAEKCRNGASESKRRESTERRTRR